MTNLVILSFADEKRAIDASHKLSDLESFGDITVYEKVFVKKDADGKVTLLQTDSTEGLRVFSGMAIGTLIGALAGPVGMLAGMFAGTLTGAALETDYYDFSTDFVSKSTSRLQPGTVAIVAEIDEDSPAFIDNAVTPLKGTVTRSDVDYAYSEFVNDQVDEIDEEIAAERAMLKSAADAEKSKIQKRINQLKEKRKEKIAEIKEKQKALIAKVGTVVKEDRKSKLKNRINKHQARIAALEGRIKAIDQ